MTERGDLLPDPFGRSPPTQVWPGENALVEGVLVLCSIGLKRYRKVFQSNLTLPRYTRIQSGFPPSLQDRENMPVFTEYSTLSRDLRNLPSFAPPLPRLSPKFEPTGTEEKYEVVIAGVGAPFLTPSQFFN
jgi:hypothetical protein